MLVVQVEKPQDEPLARWFEQLRTWLDTNDCQGVTFTRSLRETHRLLYRLSFEDQAKAAKFSATFARYLPGA